MDRFRIPLVVVLLLPLLPASFGPRAVCADEEPVAVDFNREIRPILSQNCFICHGPDAGQRQADLRLDTPQGAAAALQPGQSDASELYQRIASDDPDLQMPPPDSNRSLTARQIELVKRWIDRGAAWGDHWSFSPLRRPPLPVSAAADADPTKTPNPEPFVGDNPIDLLVQARLAERGLRLSPEADRATLIRRLSLDLTGLPPTLEEVERFLKDTDPRAWERLVDRLLKSPHFGERMAWDWLDAARYADSNGYQGDRERTMWPWRDWVVRAFNENLPFDQFTVWQLAGDLLPEATFEQKLATGFCRNHMINGEGGRIAEENRVDYIMDMSETTGTVWLGLTFNCCRCHDHKFDPLTRRDYYQLFAFFNQTPITGGGGDPQTAPVLSAPDEAQRARIAALTRELAEIEKQLDERKRQLANEQSEWERRQREQPRATSARPMDSDRNSQPTPAEPAIDGEQAARAARDAALATDEDRRDKSQRELLAKWHQETDEAHQQLAARQERTREQLKKVRDAVPQVMVMQELVEPRKTFMLERGLYNKPGEEVTAATPGRLPALPRAGNSSGSETTDGTSPADVAGPSNRLDLAQWLVDSRNPLTARVTVNRFWQQLFGIGLVKTTEDFGSQGELPMHGELLDWLACEFRDSGWDVKALLRLIVTSQTYRQSSRAAPQLWDLDPENRLLARGPRFRMPSWMLRDQALAASGLLASRIGGPPVNGYQPAGVWEEATFGNKRYTQDHGESLYRRSLYTFWRRIVAPTMFFDNASRQTCTVNPLRTNTPLHALVTLNDVTFVEAARSLAQQVLLAGEDDDQWRLDQAYRRVLARSPGERERQILLAGLNRTRQEFARQPDSAGQLLAMGESPRDERLDAAEHASWTALCLAILNLDAAVTKE